MEFDIADGILRKYKGTSIDVIVPDGVEKISKNAFSGSKIRSVVLPDSVTQLRPRAFANCKELKSIVLSQQISELPKEMCFDCVALELIVLPPSVTIIREKAFYGCSSLACAKLSDSVTEIERAVFMGCSSLSEIQIPDKVKRIAENTFRGCGRLESVTLPISLKTIGNSAFMGCESLREVEILDKVEHITENTFKGCSNRKKMPILGLLKSIGRSAFDDYQDLNEVAMDTDNYISIASASGLEETRWLEENGDDFVMLSEKQLFRYKGKERIVTIPSNIKCISTDAFYGNETIEELTIPSTVKMAHNDAFRGCNALKKVWYGAEESQSSIFDECDSLEEIYFADNVSSVGSYSLYNCRSLKYVRLSAKMRDVEISVLPRFSSFDLELPHTKGNAPKLTLFNYGGVHRIFAPYLTSEDIRPMGSALMMRTAMGYIDMCIEGRRLSEEIHNSWKEYIVPKAASLLKDMNFSIEVLDYMCKNRLLNGRNTGYCLEMLSGNVEAVARLLEHKQTLEDTDDYTLD